MVHFALVGWFASLGNVCLGGVSAAGEPAYFNVAEPDMPVEFNLEAPARERFGRTPKMRLIYYVPPGREADDEDRRTILKQIKLIRDFYRYFGLDVPMEKTVVELHGERTVHPKYRRGAYDYDYVVDLLQRRRLFVPNATIVFSNSDQGLGGAIAFTIVNDSHLVALDCPVNHSGDKPWWCARGAPARWGGILHEVGHMLGLPHPPEGREAETVMGAYWDFSTNPKTGLSPDDLAKLKANYGKGGSGASQGQAYDDESWSPDTVARRRGGLAEARAERRRGSDQKQSAAESGGIEGKESWECQDRGWRSDGRCYTPRETCNPKGERVEPGCPKLGMWRETVCSCAD